MPRSGQGGRDGNGSPPLIDSIAARLLKIIFGCYFVVTVVVTCIQLVAEYRHTEERLLHEIEAMQQTFGPGITDAMWHFNDDVLRGILSGVKDLPIVIGVKVEDAQGKVVRAAGIIQDQDYFQREIVPALDGQAVQYVGSVSAEARDRLLGRGYALNAVHAALVTKLSKNRFSGNPEDRFLESA